MIHVQAQPLPCLDLCDLVALGSSSDEMPARIRELSARWCGPACLRIYAGSSFCPQALFASRGLIDAAAAVCAESGIKMTLVLPILAQRFLGRGLAFAEEVVAAHKDVIDEVAVNDLGLASWLAGRVAAGGTFGQVSLHLGRLLAKDTRDPRDPYFTASSFSPNLIERGEEGSTLERLAATGLPIAGIMLDPTHAAIDLAEAPPWLSVSVHGPLCYLSCGQICEFAAIGHAAEESFRPNAPCSLQCLDASERYEGASGVPLLKIGRALYWEPQGWQVTGAAVYRQLCSPLGEVRG